MHMHRSGTRKPVYSIYQFIIQYDILGWGPGYFSRATYQKHPKAQLLEVLGENAPVRFGVWIHTSS